jgi:hypothetical protein
VSSHDLDDVSLELLSQVLTIDLCTDALVVERPELVLVIDIELLLSARRRVSNVELQACE